MKTPVIAIGLHAFSPVLLEAWTAQGYLKNLSRLMEQGTYGRLDYSESSNDIQRWTGFLSGCLAKETGYRGRLKLNQGTYDITEDRTYDFSEYPAFYDLGDDYRMVIYQTPRAQLSERINGIQVLKQRSHPPELYQELKSRYGKSPHYKEYGCWWERTANVAQAKKDIKASSKYHTAICKDLIQRDNWDFFLAVMEEPHWAGHDFWHVSQPEHPLHQYMKREGDLSNDPLLEIYEEADRALGELLAAAPENAAIVIFSIDGMGYNTIDLPSMFFLPEFLYRFSFPGKAAIAPGESGKTPPPPITNPKRQSWAGEIWQLKHEPNPIKRMLRQWAPGKYQDYIDQFLGTPGQPSLASPHQVLKQAPTLGWQPTMWYRPLWSQMKAFALPSFGKGFVRINLQGREPQGIVSPSEYDALCDELTRQLYELRDGRTGQPVVEKVFRTRQSAYDDSHKLHDADLIVAWKDYPIDVIDTPNSGRIGPVPFCNTGGHKPVGFVLAKGAGIDAGAKIPTGHLLDLAPTILHLMDAPIPDHFEGKSLINKYSLAN